jgi:hypothetical protein
MRAPEVAQAKQRCWAHIEQELAALAALHFAGNRQFAQQIFPIIHSARTAHRDYHDDKMSRGELHTFRSIVEAELAYVLNHPPAKGWPSDAQGLANRFNRHWQDWFTFRSHPEAKPDNNDAERGLRRVVIHRKVSGGTRSHWGGQLVAMMFSFLETMRLQGKNAVVELFKVLAPGRDPPLLESAQ